MPARLFRQLSFVFLVPDKLEAPLAKQLSSTLVVLKRQKFTVIQQKFTQGSGGRLDTALEAVVWGARLSIALAATAKLDPLAIPWVTWMKTQRIENRK